MFPKQHSSCAVRHVLQHLLTTPSSPHSATVLSLTGPVNSSKWWPPISRPLLHQPVVICLAGHKRCRREVPCSRFVVEGFKSWSIGYWQCALCAATALVSVTHCCIEFGTTRSKAEFVLRKYDSREQHAAPCVMLLCCRCAGDAKAAMHMLLDEN